MNTQRFVWAATTLLFGIAGAIFGASLGQLYTALPVTLGLANSSLGQLIRLIPPTLSIGFCIVLARCGSALADKVLLPSVRQLHDLSAVERVLGVGGAFLGLVFGVLVTLPIPNAIAPSTAPLLLPIKFCIMAVTTGLGMAFFGGMRAEMLKVFPQLEEEVVSQFGGATPKFLDTNIIIDGRLADICKTGFIEGPLFVPQFVLEEVQYIADSSDSMRRARGRRGLDVLNEMRELTAPHQVNGQTVAVPLVHVLSDFSPTVQKIAAVDSKLVALAKEKHGSIITNDFNLNKVAELQGVRVLNLNELTQSLKPVVLPGEEMQITLVKEGKEPTQGVGYLEDGTMVVVGEGATHIGETCRVTISTVYQTVAGKMIFAELSEKDAKSAMRGSGDDLFESEGEKSKNDDFGHRSGGGLRRKGRS
ncbi:MAG: PIN domain nuclease [Armatimonadetes bacterium]|nr:PIN domain nuclease [Armatimonadota bacterium]